MNKFEKLLAAIKENSANGYETAIFGTDANNKAVKFGSLVSELGDLPAKPIRCRLQVWNNENINRELSEYNVIDATINLGTLKKGDFLMFVGRRWFDRQWGNTYHSVQIFVNGDMVRYFPFNYGYDESYVQTAMQFILKYYTMPEGWKEGDTTAWHLKDFGVTVTKTVSDVSRRKDL